MALTKPLMPVWIFMLEVFGRDRDLHSSTLRCVTPMHTYRDLTPKLIYEKHENNKNTEKRQYAERVMEIEQGTFTPQAGDG